MTNHLHRILSILEMAQHVGKVFQEKFDRNESKLFKKKLHGRTSFYKIISGRKESCS